MLKLKTASLKAALLCAAVKDVRYYLNGVCVRVDADQRVYVESCDGNIGFQDRMDDESAEQKGPFSIIIPADAIKAATKTRDPYLTLGALLDGRYTLGLRMFTPIAGHFPPVDRVMPVRLSDSAPKEWATYDPELLVLVHRAMRVATGYSKAFFVLQSAPLIRGAGGKHSQGPGLMYEPAFEYPRCVICPLIVCYAR